MGFTLNGVRYELSAEQVVSRLAGVAPEPVRQHGVLVAGTLYPVKQAFEVAVGVPRSEFTSHIARRNLASMGFDVTGNIAHRAATSVRDSAPVQHGSSMVPPGAVSAQSWSADEAWHTEAEVQAAVVSHLVSAGWRILSVADTASRQHGVDVIAAPGDGPGVGVEVKGYPSRSYADPARSAETKRTQPSTQAGHWYAQAVLAAMRLRSKRPELRSVIALPDFSRYRDLYAETRASLDAANIELWWVTDRGEVSKS